MGITRARVLIRVPLPRVWDFIIRPENMHLWGPYTRPLTGFDRPFAAGDQVRLERKDFIRRRKQTLLVEEVVPFRSLRLRDLSPGAEKLDVTATVTVEDGAEPGTTWIAETIGYTMGKSRAIHWLDRSLLNPVFQVLAGFGTRRAFRRLQANLLAQS